MAEQSALQRLMFFNDMPGPDVMARLQQEKLARRNATPWRNFGPDDLMTFPDRNAFMPDDVMQWLTMPSQGQDL